MSPKSQAMLLAFGDSTNNNNSNTSNSNNSNLQTSQFDHASSVNLETSCNTVAATAAAATATSEPAIKLYPQLLLRIGQTESEAEVNPASDAAGGSEMAPTSTIISCNVADDVRNVLRATAEQLQSGETAERDGDASQVALVDWPTGASTETVGLCAPQHTVKIQIANDSGNGNGNGQGLNSSQSQPVRLGKQISVVKLNDSHSDSDMVLRLKQQQLEHHEQQQQLQLHLPLQQQQQQQQLQTESQTVTAPYQLCYLVSSGQYSPCETLDSGTGSDLEIIKSPSSETNVTSNMSHMSNMSNMSNSNKGNTGVPKLELHLKTTRIRVNTSSGQSGNHSRAHSLTDSSEECDESSSSLSCDSLHDSHEPVPLIKLGALLPSSLLRDIRDRDAARAMSDLDQSVIATKIDGRPLQYEADQYYNFHVNEHANYRSFGPVSCSRMSPEYESLSLPGDVDQQQQQLEQEDAFAGLKDVRRFSQSSTIRSSKGTVRGVKNRVRNGVATFLQLQQPNIKVSALPVNEYIII
ncbi:glutaredoxin domain-containing cysteine-rich protein CG12206-like, partial [Drosophila navojoa]|uniref:glutaredoxin domain-containing cysteine-rich protein CG12206-like n=1 Tax=Drosophila navojoa TaxID=7232 RepID=UPI0011BDB4F1